MAILEVDLIAYLGKAFVMVILLFDVSICGFQNIGSLGIRIASRIRTSMDVCC
ncbi:hypothetical protein L873DRAFT_86199 [Choiromyces venosus 120613-1]|uniref:Uncharacterized protein n=1 Tax=Choiromyces venosus 120613-1 TaxID=1336337 RepID=A0A3N4J487_9PEZI|nr:hypothetical protein L873DRAFT_86199 [Choiromyces venosus 120613-1]